MAARPLGPAEQDEVAGLVRTEAELSLFWDQPRPDRRHGLEAARRVRAARPGRADLARAALLHDVGKRHARLGPLGRSLATAAPLLGGRSSRFVAYRDHGRLGAEDLERAGAEPLAVAFARHHHGARPDGVAPEDWDVLQAADRAFLGPFPRIRERRA